MWPFTFNEWFLFGGIIISIAIALGGWYINWKLTNKSIEESKKQNNVNRLFRRLYQIEPTLFFQMRVEDITEEERKNAQRNKDKKRFFDEMVKKYKNRLTKQRLINNGRGNVKNWESDYKLYVEKDGFIEKSIDRNHRIYTDYIAPGDDNLQIETLAHKDDVFERYRYCIVRIRYLDIDNNEYCFCRHYWNKKGERTNAKYGKVKSNRYILNLKESATNRKICKKCNFESFERRVQKQIF